MDVHVSAVGSGEGKLPVGIAVLEAAVLSAFDCKLILLLARSLSIPRARRGFDRLCSTRNA